MSCVTHRQDVHINNETQDELTVCYKIWPSSGSLYSCGLKLQLCPRLWSLLPQNIHSNNILAHNYCAVDHCGSVAHSGWVTYPCLTESWLQGRLAPYNLTVVENQPLSDEKMNENCVCADIFGELVSGLADVTNGRCDTNTFSIRPQSFFTFSNYTTILNVSILPHVYVEYSVYPSCSMPIKVIGGNQQCQTLCNTIRK